MLSSQCAARFSASEPTLQAQFESPLCVNGHTVSCPHQIVYRMVDSKELRDPEFRGFSLQLGHLQHVSSMLIFASMLIFKTTSGPSISQRYIFHGEEVPLLLHRNRFGSVSSSNPTTSQFIHRYFDLSLPHSRPSPK